MDLFDVASVVLMPIFPVTALMGSNSIIPHWVVFGFAIIGPALFYLVFRKGEKIFIALQLFALVWLLKGFIFIGLPVAILIGQFDTKTGIIVAAFFFAGILIIGPSFVFLYTTVRILSGSAPDLKEKKDSGQLIFNPAHLGSLAEKSGPAVPDNKRLSALATFVAHKREAMKKDPAQK